MLGKKQKLCIIALVIAVIVVFVDANDLTKFSTTTLVEKPKKTTLIPTTHNAQMNSKVAIETTTTSTVAEATIKKDFLIESATRKTTTTKANLSSVKTIEDNNQQNNIVNYQNVSRVNVKKNATRDLVNNNVKEIVKDDGSMTSTQMKITEILSDEQRRHGHINDNVIQRKLQQTNENAKMKPTTTTTTSKPTAKVTTTGIDNSEGVHGVKLAEFVVNDRNIRKHEIPKDEVTVTTRNIVDLYPLEKSDLETITLPIVFTYKDLQTSAEYRQNLLPNEVEITQQQKQQYLSETLNKRQTDMTNLRHGINDFTGKLLAEEDGGVITEIEHKFRIDELPAATTKSTITTKSIQHSSNLESLDAAIAKVFAAAAAKEGNTLTSNNASQVFLDRRVKKSYDISKQQRATTSSTITTTTTTTTTPTTKISKQQLEHNDFAQTKFSNGSNGKTLNGVMQPEFSTTKFYNSKELYNEMMNSSKNNNSNNNNKNLTNLNNNNNNNNYNNNQNYNNTKSIEVRKSNQYAVLTNPKFKTFRKSKDMNLPSYAPATGTASAVTSSTTNMQTTVKPLAHVLSVVEPKTITTTTTIIKDTTPIITTETPKQVESNKIAALERIKWRLKAILPVVSNNNNNNNNSNKNTYISHNTTSGIATTITEHPKITKYSSLSDGTLVTGINTTTANSYQGNRTKTSDNANASNSKITKITTTKTPKYTMQATKKSNLKNSLAATSMEAESFQKILKTTTTSAMALKQHRATNPTKSSLKPISRPRTLSQLQLKINSLECEIVNVVSNAHLWRGNETHELLLPIMVSK